ncbi:hypothetical protein [Gluconobacter kondonii]|uniref:hypothetical protein n=1 Tax=Gluconobacter kondonii TaxID=941463 RepID=UPI00197CEFA3|nr:hypothetical protein [Gluconobacter kondonii]MBN3866424.1 hypothetical protein [Gluconobacter kondonii]
MLSFLFRRRPQEVEPDYGAVDDTFPLWAAREAVSQIEKRYAAQNAALMAYEARATTLLGWLSAIVLAVLSASVSHMFAKPPLSPSTAKTLVLLLSVLFPAFFSGIFLLSVFRPKKWTSTVADIDWLTTDIPQNPSEFEILKEFAAIGRVRTLENDAELRITFGALTAGRRWFLAIPASASFVSLVITLMTVSAGAR